MPQRKGVQLLHHPGWGFTAEVGGLGGPPRILVRFLLVIDRFVLPTLVVAADHFMRQPASTQVATLRRRQHLPNQGRRDDLLQSCRSIQNPARFVGRQHATSLSHHRHSLLTRGLPFNPNLEKGRDLRLFQRYCAYAGGAGVSHPGGLRVPICAAWHVRWAMAPIGGGRSVHWNFGHAERSVPSRTAHPPEWLLSVASKALKRPSTA